MKRCKSLSPNQNLKEMKTKQKMYTAIKTRSPLESLSQTFVEMWFEFAKYELKS
uniref:Uncharacterized protein n=1 Tax=Arion vulgaris TaxID=1028688 RepID=A0A0B6ZQJ9_9EUPU